MAIVMFGLPFLVFGFLIAMLCCLEPSPEDNLEHEGYEEQRQVNEDEKGNIENVPANQSTRLKKD